jgi:Flp pilus assembly protein TadD
MPSNIWLPSLLAFAVVAGEGSNGGSALSERCAALERLSQRLAAGDTSAIDELLACTKPASPDHAPSSADIERLRVEVERLRAARPSTASAPSPATAAKEESSAVQADPDMALREARAWLRAGDPSRALKSLPAGDKSEGETLYVRACALERLGRDREALDAYRRVAASGVSPLLKASAASGVEHLDWRMHRTGSAEERP